AARSEGRSSLLEPEAKTLVSALGIAVPKGVVVSGVDEVTQKAASLTPPLVLKVVSPDILHKTDAGGVVTGIKSPEDAASAVAAMSKAIAGRMPDARIHGYLLEEMAKPGVEVIVGCFRDPQFGPVVMFGTGGVMVELMKDVSFRIAPVSRDEALEMIREVKGYPLLAGFRGRKAVDLEPLAAAVVKLSETMMTLDDMAEMEINPLFVYEKGVTAVDVRVILK
ncbi:MAG: acetate--CoA ligase family protein, partial [Nitrospirota bacterium]|nr:acetate--CoA ligase family protein [Nitrospirota bacterium]